MDGSKETHRGFSRVCREAYERYRFGLLEGVSEKSVAPVSSFVFVRNICMLLQRCVCRGTLRAVTTQLPYTAAGLFCAIFRMYGAGQKCRPYVFVPATGVPGRLQTRRIRKRRDPVLKLAESLCHVVFGTVELKGSRWPRLVACLLSEHSSRFSSVDIGISGAPNSRKLRLL